MPEPTTELRDLTAIPGFDSRPSISPESADELDKLLKEKEAEPAVVEPAKTDAEPAVEPVKLGGEPEPKTDKLPEIPPPVRASDDLDAVQLPPYSKPKTGEAFETVKKLAREKISTVEQERDALKKERDELAVKAGNGLSAEVETELKELRTFRKRLDVEADPEFKSFDKSISDNVESIYARMKAGGFTDAHIEEVKKLGGPDNVDWDSLSSKISSTLKRFIDTKLVENEGLADKKSKAIEEAKKNADEYLRNREEVLTAGSAKDNKQVELKIKELVPQLGWLEERRAKDGASSADKGLVEKHNKLVKESNEFLAQAQNDTSPELRSLLAVGYVQLLKAREDNANLKTTTDEKIKGLEIELKKANDLLEKVKNSSTARLQPASAPDAPAGNPSTDNINLHPAQAIDNLMKERMAAR